MIPTANIRHESTVLMHLKAVDVPIMWACWHLGTDADWLSEAEEESFGWDRLFFLSSSCFSQRLGFSLSTEDEAFGRESRARCGFLSDDLMWWSTTESWGTTVTGKSGKLAVNPSNIWDGSEDVFLSEAAWLTTSEHQATSSRILQLLVKSIPLNV